ncbi:MAG TPA: hypothetical protein VLA95_11730 [Gemmatimonadales bacterium]|nr:hypothetical protein [Gemmatimonadales bacterium]
MPDSIPLFTPTGAPVGDWRAWGAPRKPGRWRPGRSANELARAWFTSPAPVLPAEVRALLESHPATRGVVLDKGFAQYTADLPGGAGENRQFDLLLHGHGPSGALVIGVEARADETFGARLAKKLRATDEAAPDPTVEPRARTLISLLFGIPDADPAADPWSRLRWRLLTGAAGTAYQAAREGASHAVFLVHEFKTPIVDDVTDQESAADLDVFAGLLVPGTARLLPGQMAGPVSIQSPLLPRPVELLLGRAVFSWG